MRKAGIVTRGFYKHFQSSVQLDMTSFSFSEVKEVGFVILLAHLLPKIYIRPLQKGITSE